MKNRLSHQQVKKLVFKKNPQIKADYDALQDEFDLTRQLLKARKAAGLTQEQVAERMHTQKTNISRLENHPTLTITTLEKYARAVGCALKITLKPLAPQSMRTSQTRKYSSK